MDKNKINKVIKQAPEISTEAPNKKACLKTSETERKTRKRKLKLEIGKNNTGDMTSINNQQSPSILDHAQLETPKKQNAFISSDSNIEPRPIDSRKTSTNSELSWTKDISTSSTTTCVTVCSTDFVRINNKLPVIKLTDIELNKNGTMNKDVLLTNSEGSGSKSPNREPSPDVDTRSLDLSTSSITPTKSLPSARSPQSSVQNGITNDDLNKIGKALDKLTSKLKNFDLEIVNWIGYGNEEVNLDVKRLQGKVFQVLKEESEVISHCQHLKEILSNTVQLGDVIDNKNTNIHNDSAVEHDKISHDFVDHANDGKYSEVNPNSPNISTQKDDDHNFTSDKVRYMSFDQNCDDDDALSLFAESITGIDSSRLNSSATSIGTAGDFEEYVPQVIDNDRWEPSRKFTYQPTKISNLDKPNLDVKMKAVCEKQNADSTSIYKDMEQVKVNSGYFSNINQETRGFCKLNSKVINTANVNKKIGLLSSFYKPPHGMRSTVLKGICFFNLLSSCKNISCRFPHVTPDDNEITSKLVRLSEEMFIQEYMLLRNWPVLRRKYGMCFVEECKRRDLTRILVEMAIDFTMKANDHFREDAVLAVEVTECVLLHLNAVDLETCEDLLMYKMHQQRLCDVLMQAIANTQNFSRFKPVFMKLAKYILREGRTFSFDVATQILERLSILPCELPLLETLLEIVKHTDSRILENSMIGHFQKQLVVHKHLHDQFLEFKKGIGISRPVLINYEIPCVNPVVEPLASNSLVSMDREKRYTSPDTTNLDNMVSLTFFY